MQCTHCIICDLMQWNSCILDMSQLPQSSVYSLLGFNTRNLIEWLDGWMHVLLYIYIYICIYMHHECHTILANISEVPHTPRGPTKEKEPYHVMLHRYAIQRMYILFYWKQVIWRSGSIYYDWFEEWLWLKSQPDSPIHPPTIQLTHDAPLSQYQHM